MGGKTSPKRKDIEEEIDDYKPGETLEIGNESFYFTLCCDCGLRHIWHFRIIRGKNPQKDKVILTPGRDELGTKLYRNYEKRN